MVSFPFQSRPVSSWWPFLLRNLLLIASIVALAAFSAYQSRLRYEQQARLSADNLSQVLGNHITSAIEKIDLVLKTVVRDVLQLQARGAVDSHDLELFLAQQQVLLKDAKDLLIADAEGVFRFGSDVPPGFRIDISQLEYFKQLRDDPKAGLVISGPYQSLVDKQWIMVFARRMTRPDGSFAGIVSSAISADHFREMLSSLNVGAHGAVLLRAGDMSAVARFPQAPNTDAIGSKAVSRDFLENLKANPEYGTLLDKRGADEIERTVAYRRLSDFPLYVVVGLATRDYLAAWSDEVFQLVGMAALCSLITLWLSQAAQRAAQRQQATAQLLQEAVDNVTVGFAIFDARDRLVTCNQAARDFFPGFKGVFAQGARFEDIIRNIVMGGKVPQALPNIEQSVRECMRRHRAADGRQFEITIDDGQQFLVVERRTPSRHTVINGMDITELSQYRRHLEELVETRTAELKAALDQFRILVELSPTALAMFDRNLNYLATSRRWIEAHGNGRIYLIGQNMYDVHPDLPEPWKEVHLAALEGVAQSKDEDLWVFADGTRQWLRWAVHPWIDAEGRIGGIIVSTEDITDRKLAEERLAEEREARHRILEQRVAERTGELQEANRQLEGFLFAASHDLRGPLGRISSFSSLLENKYRDRLDGEGLLFLDFIRENALRLNRLIDDLLCHARIDQLTTQLQAIDLRAAIEVTLREMTEDVRETGTAVRLDLPDVQVLADRYALGQVLHNLLENALKYSSPNAEPTVEIGGEVRPGFFRLWIRDNGIGFDMEYHDKIFEIFRRLHSHAEYEGSGVGLALVKRAMERMGGRVWAESEPGQGACFYLEFEVAVPSVPA